MFLGFDLIDDEGLEGFGFFWESKLSLSDFLVELLVFLRRGFGNG